MKCLYLTQNQSVKGDFSLVLCSSVYDNSWFWVQAAGRIGSCCVSVVRVCVLLFTCPVRESHTLPCRDARLLRKSQPSAGWTPSPIGSDSEVREEGNMATESQSSHGHGDISCCWVKRLAVTAAHVNIVLMWLICLKIVTLLVLYEANIPQHDVLAGGGKKAQIVPVILLKPRSRAVWATF